MVEKDEFLFRRPWKICLGDFEDVKSSLFCFVSTLDSRWNRDIKATLMPVVDSAQFSDVFLETISTISSLRSLSDLRVRLFSCCWLWSFTVGWSLRPFDLFCKDIDFAWTHPRSFRLTFCSFAIQLSILKSSSASYLESTYIISDRSCIYSFLSKQIWERRVIRSFLVNSSVKSTPQMRCLGGIVAQHCIILDVLLCSFVSRG